VHASVRAGEWPEKLSAPGLDSETSDSTHADQRATAPPAGFNCGHVDCRLLPLRELAFTLPLSSIPLTATK
jgi:hypothetical protein